MTTRAHAGATRAERIVVVLAVIATCLVGLAAPALAGTPSRAFLADEIMVDGVGAPWRFSFRAYEYGGTAQYVSFSVDLERLKNPAGVLEGEHRHSWYW